ncbi:Mismatch repair protein MutS-like ATPase [Chitinispirillum alkaliphilum]|nr:Mismatch repair protein MutS-like ATPase [Chitinispirillum alkaliphilum]
MFNRKKNIIQKLDKSWGKPKEETFNFELIGRYFCKRDNSSAFHVVSEQTINDIDFRDVFAFADRTTSLVGQQYLYSKLLTIEKSPSFDKQEILIDYFTHNKTRRLDAQYYLSKLSDVYTYDVADLFLEKFADPPKYLIIIKLLSAVSFLTALLTVIFPQIALLLVGLFSVNIFIHYANKKYTCRYANSIQRLSKLCSFTENLLRFKLPSISETAVRQSVKSIESLKSKMKVFELEARQVSDPFMGMAYLFSEYLKVQFLLEPILVFSVLRRLKERRGDIQTFFEYCGEIDSAISIASLRAGLPHYCKPLISSEQSGLHASGLYHPLVSNCVANDITTGPKSILLTGSNMSGKSTFIRAISINTLFAQTINTSFATEFRIPPLKLYSTIRISDDVMSGKSYYFQEVLAVKNLLTASQTDSSCLFCLDEIFRGTNTIERIAIAKAVLSRICLNGNIVIVSTHDIELSGLLRGNYDLYHFREDVEDGTVHFDFKLKRGFLKKHNAIRILQINGYPQDLIQEAISVSKSVADQSKYYLSI